MAPSYRENDDRERGEERKPFGTIQEDRPARRPAGEEARPPRGAEQRAERGTRPDQGGDGDVQEGEGRRKRWQKRRRRRRGGGDVQGQGGGTATKKAERPSGDGRARREKAPPREIEGMLAMEKANHGKIRLLERQYLPSKDDVHVPPRLVQKLQLREGSILRGRYVPGFGKQKWDMVEVLSVDGKPPAEVRGVQDFKRLTSIDPDFHYAVGDGADDVSLRIVDVLAPVGRGQRGLIVSPPRAGKTTLLQKFAHAIETQYPEVHLFVLLVDERPEEATEWKRAIERGQVFVSTNDETPRNHVELAEAVWTRCKRLVELGEDVVLVLDSITRLGRAYNNVHGSSGKTMSGGLDTRALERPKQFFGSARNTETAGSLTILGTTLIETGSQMDKVIFEEFKGTGNMELVLSRKLADRRIFPAIDIEKTGTRKEEKLFSSQKLRHVNTLRRVLARMHWAEAMELLVSKLEDVERTDDFLKRFEIDPEAGEGPPTSTSPVRMRW